MITFRQLMAIARLELLRLTRDRTSLSLVITVPILQILLFGAAINLNPTGLSIAIAGGGASAQKAAQEIVQSTGYFDDVVEGLPSGQARALITERGVQVAIELPDDEQLFDELEAGNSEDTDTASTILTVYADGADPAAVGPAVAALQAAALKRQISVLVGEQHASGALVWVGNPDRNSRWVVLPPLIGVIVMISALMLGALSIVREKEQATWATLCASPANSLHILGGKMLPYLVIAAIQIGVSYAIAVWIFDVPALGDLMALFLAGLLTAFIYLSLGFTVSLFTNSQLHALQSAVALYLPSLLLSGFMFPFSAMPQWAQYVGQAMPLTHFVAISRDVMLRGGTFAENGTSILVLLAIALAMLVAMAFSGRRI